MPSLSDTQIVEAVVAAGFPRESWPTAVAVALAESGGNSDATNRNTNGSTDYGLFQINSIHADLLSKHVWASPVDNAKMALAISSNGTNWLPWVAYKTGSHRKFVARAQIAIHMKYPNGKYYNPSPEEYLGAVPEAVGGGVSGFFGAVMNGHTWVRIALVIVGAALIYLAILQANKGTILSAAKLAITKKAVK